MNGSIYLVLVLLVGGLVGCGSDNRKATHSSETTGPAVTVNWFEYQGKDSIFKQPLAAGEYQNPILAGFYPDPSIVRGGDNAYYLVNSSFGYFPGIPIFRSTDLVNWQPLGYVLTRPSQLPLDGAGTSRGIFAPTIRFHDGIYYVITTNVDSSNGNFLVTSRDPAGPWSDPILLPEIAGIDPSIFFDDDGRVYITHNGEPAEPARYEGHRAIWMWEFDLDNKKVVPDSGKVLVNGGADISQQPIWIEGPHIYKINGWYYLLCAEGGTAENHSEVVFRSRSLNEPFVPFEGNPILTQRDLPADRDNPIATTGHADMVQTPNGDWWAVFLGTRNYQQEFYNTGRETFLLPVSWQDGWPIILPQGDVVPSRLPAPKGLAATPLAEPMTGNWVHRDNFEQWPLDYRWNSLRGSGEAWLQPLDSGGLLMTAKSVKLNELQQPAFIGRRQQHQVFSARANLRLPQHEGVLAGLALYQSEQAHFLIAVKKSGTHYRVVLEKANQSPPEVVASKVFAAVPHAQSITLVVDVDTEEIRFSYQVGSASTENLGRSHDTRVLSTQWAGGFVGSYVGVHARQTSSILDDDSAN